MIRLFSLFTLVFLIGACSTSTIKPKAIQFKNPYLFTSEIEENLKNSTEPWKYQAAAGSYAEKGSYFKALSTWDRAMPAPEKNYTKQEIDSVRKNYSLFQALPYITEQAKHREIVIINEAHHSAQHRFFTKELLKELYKQGYRHLGLEALGNGKWLDKDLNQRKYPIQKTGFYTKDPQFGNLIREALKLGYKLFPYEVTGEANGKEREIRQAKNIADYMEKHSGEKVLIHCGFDHVLEGKHDYWEKAMAQKVKEFTGNDPLTIDQVYYSEKSQAKKAHPLMKALEAKTASVIINANGAAISYKRGAAWSDIAVMHPISKVLNNRAGWLFTNGNQLVELPIKHHKLSYPVMVLAYNNDEPIEEAVPVDIVELKEETDRAILALPKGTFNIVVTNLARDAKSFSYKVK